MTPARAALLAAMALLAAAAVTAIVAVPWDASVAPWAALDLPTIDAFTAEQVAAITAYVDAAWLPGILGWLAAPVAALAILLIPALRRAITSIDPRRPRSPSAQQRRSRVLADLLAGALLLVVVRLATLPFALWSAQVRRDYGLLIEPWSTWWLRWLGESAVWVALGAVGLAVCLAIWRRWPRRGWIAIVAGAALVTAALSAVLPFVQQVEGTAADPALTARIQAIADDAGVTVDRVQVIETADRSPAINATVSGWGPTRTVTVYDTVTSTADPAEVDALIAHELIHVRDDDSVVGTLLACFAAAAVAALASAFALSGRVRRRFGPSPIPLVVAVVLVATALATVAGATVSRPIEARADREALALTGDPQAYRDLIVRLAVTNRSTLQPPSWRYALFFTHPTPLQRLVAID